MSKKYTIRETVLGDDYLEDEDVNTVELKRPILDDPHYEIEGKKLYPKEDGEGLEERTVLGGDEYEKKEGVFSDHYEKKGACFITTACIKAVGLPDDCDELVVLRGFRRNALEGTEEGQALLRDYPTISRKILGWIEIQESAENFYLDLYERLVRKSVNLIKSGKPRKALLNYASVVREYEEMADK